MRFKYKTVQKAVSVWVSARLPYRTAAK